MASIESNIKELPPVRFPKRGGCCTDCGNRYYAGYETHRVNGRFVCEPCAQNYRRDINGRWVRR